MLGLRFEFVNAGLCVFAGRCSYREGMGCMGGGGSQDGPLTGHG